MAFTRVQGGSTNSGSGSASTVAVTLSAIASGNAVLGVVSWVGAGTLSSVTDDKGNTYNKETSVLDTTDSLNSAAFSRTNITNAPTVITANFSVGVTFRQMLVDEFSGGSTASTDERDGAAHGGQFQSNPGTAANGITSGTFTTGTNGDLIWGACVDGAGTLVLATNGTSFSTGTQFNATDYASQTEYRTQTTAGSGTAATLTQAADVPRTTFMISIKPPAGAAPPNGSNDYYSVPPAKQVGINATMPRLAPYESYPPRGLVPSPVVPYGKSDYYDVRLFSQRLNGAQPQWQQHDAYAIRFVQQNPPPGSGGFPWYYDRAVYPKLRFRDQHETYAPRGLVPTAATPQGWTTPYDSKPWSSLRRGRPELLVYDGQATKSYVFTVAPSGSVSFFDIEKYPALQFRHQHESYPAMGNVPTAATAQGWTAFYDVEAVPRSRAALADHETAEFTFFPPAPLWTDYYDAEVIRGRARDYIDAPTPTAQVTVVATGWGAFYDSNLNMLPPRRAAEGAVYDVEPPEPAVTFVEFGAYFDRSRLRPFLTQQHETYPAMGLVPTAATAQGWWLPLDTAVIRPVPASRQMFDAYQHFSPPAVVSLGPLGWSMFWDKGRRPLAPDRMPFLFEQLWQFPTAATPQGWTYLLDTARVKAFPARLQQYDALGRLSFPTPFVGVTFERFDSFIVRPRPFPYSVVDQQPTVVVPPSAYVLFPELFKRPRPFPYLTWPEQRVAVLNTPPGTGGPTYFYDRRLVVMHRPLAEVVPFDGRGLPFVVVNLIVHRPGKGGLLTPQVLVATKYQPALSGIKATPALGGEVED